jgi:diguanylate cyclase (GGDEF)-like protein/PAS domain S-box-containing protein
MTTANQKRPAEIYLWTVIVCGAAALLFSVYHLHWTQFNTRFLLLALATLLLGSRIVVQIPRIKGHISVSDTLILLSLLLFGGEPAILLAGADAFIASKRHSKRKITRAFNVAASTLSTFLTVWSLRLAFGSARELMQASFTPNFITLICLMGFVQYISNSGLVAAGVAVRSGQSVWQTWRDNFLWTSLTYFAGASAAGFISILINSVGIYAFLATLPIVAVIYFTYTTYLKNVEASVLQAEQAKAHLEEMARQMAEQERISRQLKESEEHFRNAFDHAAGMALLSPDGRWLQVNKSLCEMLGYTAPEMLAMSIHTVTHPDDFGADIGHIFQLIDGKFNSYQLEKRYLHKTGREVWVLQSASVIRDEQNKPMHLILQIQDITERKMAEDQIRHAAFHDALTGLPNRTLLSDRLSVAIERARRKSSYQFAVLFLDLDRFKVVNDSLGHDMGDKLLVDLSRRLEQCVRKLDTVARLGGDEFAVLLDGLESHEEAIHIAIRIQEALAAPFDLNSHEFFTSASIGIAFSMTSYDRPEDILRDADTAMYRAKANGKARHEIFDVGMHTRAMEMLKLENDLYRAVERGEIVAYFQPIVCLKTGRISGFEALARWHHPERGLVSPADFIPLAEDTGLIVPLGMMILRQSCLQTQEWNRLYAFEKPLTISVNLSGKQFSQSDLVERIKDILDEAKLAPELLRLEITETVIMENARNSIEMLQQLKALGVQFSIDDFGTGYSSLSYLNRFPFDVLKIDRSFVNRMAFEKESLGIVKTIMALANELGKAVVAEGVESENQRRTLAELGCQFGQGFFFSKPIPALDAKKLLGEQQPQAEIYAEDSNLPIGEVNVFNDAYTM